jgi:hypothetical protein
MNEQQATILTSAGTVRVYSDADVNSERVGTLSPGDIITIYEVRGIFFRHEFGWSTAAISSSGNHTYKLNADPAVPNPKPVDYVSGATTAAQKEAATAKDSLSKGTVTANADETAGEDGLMSNIGSYANEYLTGLVASSVSVGESANAFSVYDVEGIHGLPYQYLESADPRPSGSKFGRKYAERIISKMPLLILTPGKPKFMSTFSDKEKTNIITYMALHIQGSVGDALDSLIGEKVGKLYSFEFAYQEYYTYVDFMAHVMAVDLGIAHKLVPADKVGTFDHYNWDTYANDKLKYFVSSAECIAFYMDAETNVTETFSSGTTESSLAGSVNSMSAMSREFQYLLGGLAGVEMEPILQMGESSLEELKKFTDKWNLPSQVLKNLSTGLQTVIRGGKILFPEIWSESTFSRSYSINIKLRCPNPDPVSWFMDIGLPLCLLICLAAPQQHQEGSFGYMPPFLVRAYSRAIFNCDMGIVTDLSISRGDKGKWSYKDLPTEVDVAVGLKDLYQMMFITPEIDKQGLGTSWLNPGVTKALSNTIELDYIANLCGINVSKPDLPRTIDMVATLITGTLTEALTFDKFLGVEQWISNMGNMLYRGGR